MLASSNSDSKVSGFWEVPKAPTLQCFVALHERRSEGACGRQEPQSGLGSLRVWMVLEGGMGAIKGEEGERERCVTVKTGQTALI